MVPLKSGRRPLRRWIYLASPFLSFLVAGYLFLSNYPLYHKDNGALNIPSSPAEEIERPRIIAGLEDVHVVLKTGATEALAKVPVHFNTTLRYVPHFTLFSDYEEDIAGFHVYDVLRSVDVAIKNKHPEFELYRRLRATGRETLSKLNTDPSNDVSTPAGKPKNPGWILDKWKFLPMMHETLRFRDDAKWYVFMEADTYIIWKNLVTWLENFDSSKPYYLGNQMQIGDTIFAHGGSGFVLSHAALKRVVEYHSSLVKEWDTLTAEHWAGDEILGKALNNAGVGLLWSWPMLQGSTPWNFDPFSSSYNKLPWCYPPIAYHHMGSEDIRELWEFEERWFKENGNSALLRHRDVFQKLTQPRFNTTGEDWDNDSLDIAAGVETATECERHCAKDLECLQYSFGGKVCRTSKVVQWGSRKPGMVSGWMSDKIDKAAAKLGACKQTDWIRPE
ncbi:hypothetical protein MGYG_01346 [Nannizzia gypsea CBS 118893]|uniref:N-acetylgalactosaminide beta-1,3-galactosyltransferase n=1 Tax=Arthroderma gypseum (strain ATCC MYA-4604 / CBS 118893) TaxID=535722 RepID=E5R0B7_ARTGP|nr:hypothetical protein MGYG_01346 [Nannizzia gypsea CBS 118893]EFQ98313.1 hypothetical protein MGYG_01346 [Nannizzia gypsea CBS 118893]